MAGEGAVPAALVQQRQVKRGIGGASCSRRLRIGASGNCLRCMRAIQQAGRGSGGGSSWLRALYATFCPSWHRMPAYCLTNWFECFISRLPSPGPACLSRCWLLPATPCWWRRRHASPTLWPRTAWGAPTWALLALATSRWVGAWMRGCMRGQEASTWSHA